MLKSQISKGFTLIELLIVIVIIGILAGVLIAVIDPTTQQNRARDANVRATMNKIALATNGYISAYGRVPNEIEFQGGLAGFSDVGPSTCAIATEAACTFVIGTQPMPTSCDIGGVVGNIVTDSTACNYYYCGAGAIGDDFGDTCTFSAVAGSQTLSYRLFSKAFGSENVFMYLSVDSSMYLCDNTGQNCQIY